MSKKDKLIKSKSIYTIRSKHMTVADGTIYENDNVTIIHNDGIYDDDMPLFSESNFKFRIGTGNGEKRKHLRGGWLSPCGTDENVWTLNNLPMHEISSDSKIVIKPNYSSLKDFAYYGSAIELIKATVNDVAMRYPGVISYYNEPPRINAVNDNRDFYLISNETDIDFCSPIGTSVGENEDPMKVLGASYMNYEDGDGNQLSGIRLCLTGDCFNSIVGKVAFDFDGRHGSNSESRTILGARYDVVELTNWENFTVYCYNGSPSTPSINTPLEGVIVNVIAVGLSGEQTNIISGTSDSEGKCVFIKKMFEPISSNCVRKFKIKGYYENYIASAEVNFDCHGNVTLPFGELYFGGITPNVSPFENLSVNGILIGSSASIGQGNVASINIYNESMETIGSFAGLTDGRGRFSITDEDFIEEYEGDAFDAVYFNGVITYRGETKTGDIVRISDTNSQTLAFRSNSQPQEGTLIVTAYTSDSHGELTPISDKLVVFSAYTNSVNTSYFTGYTYTNARGVATMPLREENWTIIGIVNNLDLRNIGEWVASCEYSGEMYNSDVSNYAAGDSTDIIIINEKARWHDITVHAQNSNGVSLPNVIVKAFASFRNPNESNGHWAYYALGLTDSDGDAVFTQNSNWIRINSFEISEHNFNNFISWKAEGRYEDQTVDSSILFIEQSRAVIIFDAINNPTPPNQFYDNCNRIDADNGNGFFIYMDAEGKLKLVCLPEYYYNGDVILKPKDEYYNNFWNTLDDFEAVLLNKKTNPIYKARLESPYIINERHYYTMKNYIWPVVDNIGTPDLTTTNFSAYLLSLLDIATYYDEYDSDNLLRMMTHESIKNLDRSLIHGNYNESQYEEEYDYTRVQSALRCQARLYDDIKRYADNIKSMCNISYDEKNNAPDYFLSDFVELNGFEAKNISDFSGVTSDVIYSSTTIVGKTGDEINNDFMRRLALSSKYIMSMKGTRRGIEGILGMFGYKNGTDYTIDEYVAVAHNFPNYTDTVSLRMLGENEYFGETDYSNGMIGYPVQIVSPFMENPSERNYYLIPWLNNKEDYIGDTYFQEKGGWMRMHDKDINLSITNATTLTEEGFDFHLYGETIPYLVYVHDIDELTSLSSSVIYENMVCYVTDISTIYNTYSSETDYNVITPIHDDEINDDEPILRTDSPQNPDHAVSDRGFSHYFILKNTALSNFVGFVHNEYYNCYGWKNVLITEFRYGPTTEDGLRVLYLESIEENNKGNNPHCGFGKYDDGQSYISKFNYLFGPAIATGEYDYLKYGSEEEVAKYNRLLEVGFEVDSMVSDNKKCHYFLADDTNNFILGTSNDSQDEEQLQLYNSKSLRFIGCENCENDEDVEIDDGGYSDFVNPENGNNYDEAASYSVINVKNLLITFNTNGNEYFKKYLQRVVFKYLNEVIPSTAILRYKFNDGITNDEEIIAGDSVIVYDSLGKIEADGITVSSGATYVIENNDKLVE